VLQFTTFVVIVNNVFCDDIKKQTNYVGQMETLASRVKAKRKELKLSQTALAELVGVAQQAIQKVETGKTREPRFIVTLAAALKTTPEYLSGVSASLDNPSPIPVHQIRVEGTSYAGLFKDISLIEDNEHEREFVPGTVDPRYPHAHHYALNVAGDSMNKLFRDGSKVVCAAWGDLGIEVKQGHILHIERRRFASEIETTLKVYSEQDGKRWLNPNSTNEKHKPIEINGNEDTEITIKGLVLYELNKMDY
jgi:transcriptional regulator with XRE-family HTH domain